MVSFSIFAEREHLCAQSLKVQLYFYLVFFAFNSADKRQGSKFQQFNHNLLLPESDHAKL